MRRWVVVASLLAACHQDPQPTTPIAKQPSECARIGDHIVSLMSVAEKIESERLDPFRNAISKRCTEDHWSAEAKQCLGSIKTTPEGDRCEKMLTEQQAAAFEHDLEAALHDLEGSLAPPPPPPAAAAAPMAPAAAAPPPSPSPPPSDEAKSFRKAKKAKSAPGASSDPCEGGE